MLLLVIGILLLGAATAIAIRAMTLSHLRAAEQVASIGAYGFGEGTIPTVRPEGFKAALDALAAKLGRSMVARVESSESEARKHLVAAGFYTADPVTFVGYRALTGIALALLLLWMTTSGGSGGAMMLFGVMFGALGGWLVPQIVLRKRGDRRLAQIELGLPELIDLLVVTVEAGLGFSGSMQVAATKLPGPLGDEVRLALQEQRMGLSTNEALTSMLHRCDTPSMRSFVRSVIQGETLGVSIGNIMRNLATEMRKRRRAAAEERAQKAPIKMLFPLIFLIFPPLFIVLLYPAIQSFGQSIGG
jgi:tight adherence protein C